jgi:tetraprenyl-beta-curcumene synthase
VEHSATAVGGALAAGRIVHEAAALLLVGGSYWLRLQPLARRELARWEQRARAIPDETLRACALAKLADEALNPEAAALFAVLAPRSRRRRIAVFIVAFQVLYDYLDAVNEMAHCSELRIGLQLHRALTDALEPSGQLHEIYPRGRYRGDGGYAHELVSVCRDALGELPPELSGVLVAAAARCASAQSHNHALLAREEESLIEWSLAQGQNAAEYEWWEIAAGGISCLAVHALVACAARSDSSASSLASVERAYFPSVCSLSALLDSLADYYEDADGENHRFVAHYRDGRHAAGRLVAIAAEASTLLAVLPDAARHKVIMVGICTYYLSCASAIAGFPSLARRALLERIGWLGTPMLAATRARRRLHTQPATRPRQQTLSPARSAPGAGGRRTPGALGRRVRAAWPPRSREPPRGPAEGQA